MLDLISTLAHTGHEHSSFGTGFIHPLNGLDHLLAMVAVGLLSARMDTKKMWTLPAAFVSMMAVGGLLGMAFASQGLTAFEWGISVSVLVLGLAVVFLTKMPPVVGHVVVACFAICHGYAHFAEIGTASAWGYFPGMLTATGLLHLAGLLGGVAMLRGCGDWALRGLGGTITAIYMLALTGVIG